MISKCRQCSKKFQVDTKAPINVGLWLSSLEMHQICPECHSNNKVAMRIALSQGKW